MDVERWKTCTGNPIPAALEPSVARAREGRAAAMKMRYDLSPASTDVAGRPSHRVTGILRPTHAALTIQARKQH